MADGLVPASGAKRRLTRRQAIFGGGGALVVGGAAAATGVILANGGGATASAYPRLTIAKLTSIRPNVPVVFRYPLKEQVSVLVDFGYPVPGGVGPKQSIVAYSKLCQHMGCEVEYQPALRELVCPCHQSRFDPERLGSIIQGLANLPLPRVLLEVRDGAVDAVGVDGLIYGYRDNLAPGQPAGGAQ